jgi:Winged helix domain
VLTLSGREAWALLALVEAGERGCTPIDTPAPRWSAYVHDLRKLGFAIETIRERHGGPFAGEHARYVLRSPVVILAAAHAAAL